MLLSDVIHIYFCRNAGKVKQSTSFSTEQLREVSTHRLLWGWGSQTQAGVRELTVHTAALAGSISIFKDLKRTHQHPLLQRNSESPVQIAVIAVAEQRFVQGRSNL